MKQDKTGDETQLNDNLQEDPNTAKHTNKYKGKYI